MEWLRLHDLPFREVPADAATAACDGEESDQGKIIVLFCIIPECVAKGSRL